jgi:hypothetical protein
VCAAVTLAAAVPAQTDEASGEATSAMPISRIVTAVASTPGVGGSFFKTSLQLFNQYTSVLHGRLVFHPAGATASSNDPGLDVDILPGETVSYDDVLEAMGLSGLGTLDVLMPTASNSPVIVARVYDDAGASGTSGFNEDAISPNETGPQGRVLTSGNAGHLILPEDTDGFRFNIGIRMLSTGGFVQFLVRDSSGAIIADVLKSLASNSFVQSEAGAFLGLGVSLPPAGSIRVRLTGGSAIVYGATIDNTTQDSSIQFARSGA